MANHRFKQKDTQRHYSAVMFIYIVLCILSTLTPQAVCVLTCGRDFTSSYGVVVSPSYPQTYPVDAECMWHIHPNETQTTNRTEVGVTLDFRRFQTLDVTSRDVETLSIFTSDPSNVTSTPAPYRQFRGKNQDFPSRLSVSSDELWLVFRSAPSRTLVPGETLGFRILYLANGADVQCDANPLAHGRITNDSHSSLSLRSTVRFECDRGYRMEGEVAGQCILDGDGVDSVSPRWSNIPSCVSTCPTPASIANGTYVKNGPLEVNSTVTYSCDVPYLLNRQDPTVTCGLGTKGTPAWDSNPPGCSIPSCRSTVSISLTSPSGALVNPSFPSHSVLGGTNCQWQVRVQSDKAVNFNVTYFDLPQGAQLSFLDALTKRVYRVFKGEDGTPTERSFNVSTSSVHVVYNGADTASSTNQGFYISYRAVEPSTPLVPPTTSTTARLSTATPIMTSSHHGPPSSEKVITDNDDSGSSDAGKIAGGVVAGIIAVLLVVAFVGFRCYRKKFPVRMTGRSFGKFSNPEYRAPGRASTLVREDAGDYFEHQMQPESHSQVNIILGGDEENRVEYVNTAFQYDSHDSDEEEVERRFRERKSYLFKKDEDDETDGKKRERERRQGGSSTSGERSKKAKKSKENGRIGRDGGHENAAYVDSEAESVSSSYSSDISDSASTKEKKSNESLNGESCDAASLQSADQPLPAEGETNTEDEDAEIPHYAPGIVKPRSASMSTEAMPAMTVKQFLARIAREKRANSDVSNPRPGSLTSFDITKSARRRAQSAGDIWDTVAVSAPELSKLATASEDSSRENQQPLGRESRLDTSVENLSELPDEVTAGGSRRVSSSSSEQSNDYINVNSVTGDMRRDIAPESSSPEDEKDATERDRSKSSTTSSSSEGEEEAAAPPARDQQAVFSVPGLSTAADSSLEDRSASSQGDKSDEDSDHPEVGSLPKEDSDLDDTLPRQVQMVASHSAVPKASNDTPENSSENEDSFPTPPPPEALQARPSPVGAEDGSLSHSFVVLSSTDAGQSESKDAESISSEESGSSVESARTSSGAELESYSVNVDVPEERRTESGSNTHASNRHHNPDESEEEEQKYSLEKRPPSEDYTDFGYEHSTPTKHQMPGEMSVGEAKTLHQAGVDQHPPEAPKKKAVTVEGLTSLTYSDGSSSTSSSSESDESDDEGDTRKKNDETRLPLPTSAIPISPSKHKDAETGHKDVRTLLSDITFTSGSPDSNSSSSSEQHEPQPMQLTFTEASHGTQSPTPEHSDRLQFMGAAAGDQPSPRTLQLGRSSPEQSPRPRGLAALRKQPEQSDRLQFLGQPADHPGDQPAPRTLQLGSSSPEQSPRPRGLAALRKHSEQSDRLQFLGTAGDHPADQQGPRTLQLGSSSPELSPRPRGLAALRGHPSTRRDSGSRHSDSDSDLEFTEEDIDRVLEEESDVSSEDGPPPLPISPPPGAQKVAVKPQPSEMFVFDEEDNEDIEC